MRSGEFQQGGEGDAFRRRRHHIPEADIDLQRNTRSVECGRKRHAHAPIDILLPDGPGFDGSRLENQPVRLYVERAEFLKQHSKTLRGRVACAQQVQVSGSSVRLLHPEQEQQRPFEEEPLGVGRLTEPIEEPFQGVLGEQALKVILAGFRQREQALPYRGAQIDRFRFHRASASR
jgi:hypothetical protein